MLLRQALLYLPAQFMAPLIQLISLFVWAYLLEPGDLGRVALILAIQEIAYLLFFGWWSLSVLRFLPNYREAAARAAYLRTETSAVAACLVLQMLALGGTLVLTLNLSPASLTLALGFMLTRSLNLYAADRARAEQKILLYTLVKAAIPTLGFLLGLLCIPALGASGEAIFAGLLFAQLGGIVLALAMTDFARDIGVPSREILRRAAAFGSLQSLSGLLAAVAINAPRLLVGALLGVTALGKFSVGYGLGVRASSFAVTLVTAGAYPLLVKTMHDQGPPAAIAQLSRNMVFVAVVVIPVAFGLVGISASVVELLVAHPYRTVTAAVLPIAVIGGLFRYLRAHTIDQLFLLYLKPGYGTAIALLDLLLAAGGTVLGIHFFGLIGAALAPMFAGITTLMLGFAIARWHFGFHPPVAAIARAALAGMLSFAAVVLLPVATSLVTLAAHILFGAIVYAFALTLLLRDEAATLTARLAIRLRQRAPAPPQAGN